MAATSKSKGKALTAAAQILSGPRVQRLPVARARNYTGLPWQAEAWQYLDEVGEFQNAIDWQAKGVSRMALAPAREQPGVDEPEIIDSGLAADLVAGFAGGTDGQRQLLWRAAQHLQVAGESYIVGRDVDGDQVWEAYSNEEIKPNGARRAGWSVDDGVDKFDVKDSDVLIRAWRPSPRRRAEPTSSAKAARPILAVIRGLNSHVLAQVDSRLAGAGLLILPQSMTFAAQSGQDLDDGEDPFVAELLDAMITPIKDRDSAAAVVPIVIKVPDEALGKAQYLRFADVLDANLPKLTEQGIQRLARALDTPPEVLLGLGSGQGVNHWNAWEVSEDAVQNSIAPVASIVTHALTVGWFRPALESEGESPEGMMVWPDPTPLLLRPDRSKAATEGHDRLVLSDEGWRRESGFDDDDKPDDDEFCRRLIVKLITTKPDLAPQLWPALGACGVLPAVSASPAGDAPPDGDEGTGSDTEPDTEPEGRGLPDRDNAPDEPPAASRTASAGSAGLECLALASHGAVVRALEVAGKRLLSKSPRSNRSLLADVPPHRLHEHLTVPSGDSIELAKLTANLADSMHVALEGYPVCVDQLVEYVCSLVAAGEPHDPAYLTPILSRCAGELADVS